MALTMRKTRIPLGRSSMFILILPALVMILALFVYPFFYGLLISFQTQKGAWTGNNYAQFFTTSYQFNSIWITFSVALPVTLASLVISIPLAYVMRRGVRFERLLTAILLLPMTLGTVLVAQAMTGYFGPGGWFNEILLNLHLIHAPLPLLYNWLSVEIALFIQNFPFAFLILLGYMSALNPDLEQASRMLGASTWNTFWRVIFPLAMPGIALAFCLTFVSNFGVFPTAQLIGDPSATTHVLSIVAYNSAYSDYNIPLGTAVALVMGIIQLLVVMLVFWMRNRWARGATISGGKGA